MSEHRTPNILDAVIFEAYELPSVAWIAGINT